ncbi:transmembrane BAX inhibitor motif-containing protein [Klebsormidium nitens]|uniref:Transmembrane BAX inhibitor motif-containing protein n=1 Tax=Klebsormidium nitens TaxID=105231 RepID=A0A1Y1I0S1_KLENI|nr:transmembrane BAX inhibitor motif-containing protein [Klebsormidium nitens]|eukprot:GAQ83562.1 transmembrane BAX inhibitor motif-containing protein [Klebsormidium nitens]
MYGSFGQKGPQSGYSDVQRSTGAGKGFAWGRTRGYDEEAGTSLYPGLEGADAEMRWGFIRKVYGILTFQILLTLVTVGTVVAVPTLRDFIVNTPGLYLVLAISPIILIFPLACYSQSHPLNLVLLAVYTIALSLSVGVIASFTAAPIVFEALLLTFIVVASLTAYTFYAVRQGADFSYLGPILWVSVLVLIGWGFLQIFFPMGHVSRTIYAALGALVFSVYIVYDTENLIKRHSYDEYIWASVMLYIDVLNLFINLLSLLRETQDN